MCDQQSLRSAYAYAQSDQSLCLSLEYSMTVKLLTEHHLKFLSISGGCTGSSESSHVKMPHCLKSHAAAQLLYSFFLTWFKYLLALRALVQDMLPDVQPHKSLYNGTESIRLGQTCYLGIISTSPCLTVLCQVILR